MNETPRKLRFEDLQPHVEMLIDALENRGASSSGISYNENVYQYADKYRTILKQIRNKSIVFEKLMCDLQELQQSTLNAARGNQTHRIVKIIQALDTFIVKEYNKIYN